MKILKIIKIYFQSGEYSTNVQSYCDLLREMLPCAEIYTTSKLNDGIDPDILIVFGSLEWFREERSIHGLTFGCSDYIYVNFSELIHDTDIKKFEYNYHKYEQHVVSDLADLIYQLNLTDNKVDKVYSSLFKALRSLAGMTAYFNVNGSDIANVYINLSKEKE